MTITAFYDTLSMVIVKKFKVGQTGVYPAYGVVRVQGIEDKEICGSRESFYILQVVESDVKVMVPTENASSVGLRPVVPKKQVPKILKILGKKGKNNHSSSNGNLSWNKRYREYADKLKSGDIFEVAHVLKDIHGLRKDKELSFGEKRIMDNAFSLLVKEISAATNKKEELITTEIEKLLS